jgi:hypothetical protein
MAASIFLDALNVFQFFCSSSQGTTEHRGAIGLDELAGLDIIHGPRRDQAGTYDAWTKVLQAVDPRFGFTDPRSGSRFP